MLVNVAQGDLPLYLVGHVYGLDLVQQEGHPHPQDVSEVHQGGGLCVVVSSRVALLLHGLVP